MKSFIFGVLNPLKSKQSDTINEIGDEYIGNFNKSKEQIKKIKFDIDLAKDKILKLNEQLMERKKELQDLKSNKFNKNSDYEFALKVIETVIKIVDEDYNSGEFNINKTKNSDNMYINSCEDIRLRKNKNDKNKTSAFIAQMSQSPRLLTKSNKEVIYINSLKNQIVSLKQLLLKKNEKINCLLNNKPDINFSKLNKNLEKDYNELKNIQKNNEKIKFQIEDASNLFMLEEEGNKFLKIKINTFQTKFKEYRLSLEKKNLELNSQLEKAKAKERDCKIFHIRKGSIFETFGSKSSLRTKALNYDMDDKERLKFAEEEMNNIKQNINSINKDMTDIINKNENLKTEKNNLAKTLSDLTENNSKLKNEISNLNKTFINLNNKMESLESENYKIKTKLNSKKSSLERLEEKTSKIKDNITQKEEEINKLKKEIEDFKKNNKIFYTNMNKNGRSKNDREIENLSKVLDANSKTINENEIYKSSSIKNSQSKINLDIGNKDDTFKEEILQDDITSNKVSPIKEAKNYEKGKIDEKDEIEEKDNNTKNNNSDIKDEKNINKDKKVIEDKDEDFI